MSPSDPTREVSYHGAVAVTPDDNGAFGTTRALYVGGQGGNLRVLMANGADVTFTGVIAGTIYPLAVIRVFNTNTTATGIVRLH